MDHIVGRISLALSIVALYCVLWLFIYPFVDQDSMLLWLHPGFFRVIFTCWGIFLLILIACMCRLYYVFYSS